MERERYVMWQRVWNHRQTGVFWSCLCPGVVWTCQLPEGVEYHVREAGGERYIFLLNLEEKEKQIDEINGTDLLTQKHCDGTVKLEPYGVMVVKAKQG